MSSTVLDLLARTRCVGCGLDGRWLCGRCASDLPAPAQYAPLARIAAIHCPWAYDGAARDLILALKLRGRRDVAEAVAGGIVTALRSSGSSATVVTWVPGRRRDISARGFDHAREIAVCVARPLGLPARGLLSRTAARPDQVGLSAAERRANLVGAFAAARCTGDVLLVDDVVTTGATAASCAEALTRAGAKRVELAVACRV